MSRFVSYRFKLLCKWQISSNYLTRMRNGNYFLRFSTQAKEDKNEKTFDHSQFVDSKKKETNGKFSESQEPRKRLKKPQGPRMSNKEKAKIEEKAKLKKEYKMVGIGVLFFGSLLGWYAYHLSQSKIGKADYYYKIATDYQVTGEKKRNDFIKYYTAKLMNQSDVISDNSSSNNTNDDSSDNNSDSNESDINNKLMNDYEKLVELSKKECQLRKSKEFDFASDFEEANKNYLLAIKETDSKYPKYLKQYSLFLQNNLKMYDKAEEYIIKAIELHPTNALYHRQLTELLELPDYDLKDVKWATNNVEPDSISQSQLDIDNKVVTFAKMQKRLTRERDELLLNRLYHPILSRGNTVNAHLQEALYFFSQENDAKAARMHIDYALNYVIGTNSWQFITDTYDRACRLLDDYNETELCNQYWTKLITRVEPIVGRCKYGIFLYDKQEYDKAAGLLKQAIQHEPRHVKSKIMAFEKALAQNFADMPEQVKRRKEFQYRKSLPSVTDIALTTLGKIEYDKENYDSAMHYFGRALMRNTMNVDCVSYMVLCLIDLNEYKHALSLLNESYEFLLSQTKERGGHLGMTQGFSQEEMNYLTAIKYYLYGKISNVGKAGTQYSSQYRQLVDYLQSIKNDSNENSSSDDNKNIDNDMDNDFNDNSAFSNKNIENILKNSKSGNNGKEEIQLTESKRIEYWEQSNLGFFELVRKYPNDFFINYLAAKHYFENTNEMEKANKYFRVALGMQEKKATAQYDFAMFLLSRGDLQSAKRHLSKALECNPAIPRIRQAYDQLYYG